MRTRRAAGAPDVLIQFKGIASSMHALSGGAIGRTAGAVLAAVIMLTYDFLGGMRSVAWLDCVQALLMLTSFFLMLYLANAMYGGLPRAMTQLHELSPQATATPEASSWVEHWSTCVLFLSFSLYPHQVTRHARALFLILFASNPPPGDTPHVRSLAAPLSLYPAPPRPPLPSGDTDLRGRLRVRAAHRGRVHGAAPAGHADALPDAGLGGDAHLPRECHHRRVGRLAALYHGATDGSARRGRLLAVRAAHVCPRRRDDVDSRQRSDGHRGHAVQ